MQAWQRIQVHSTGDGRPGIGRRGGIEWQAAARLGGWNVFPYRNVIVEEAFFATMNLGSSAHSLHASFLKQQLIAQPAVRMNGTQGDDPTSHSKSDDSSDGDGMMRKL